MSIAQTRNAVSIFNKYAKQYHEKFRDVSLYHSSLDVFCNSVSHNGAEILELACGPGNLTRYVLKNRPDFKLLGTDLAPNMLAIAELVNPTAKFIELDCRNLSSLGQKFHGVICGFCLPYLSKEECHGLFKTIFENLHESGSLYISTMEEDDHNKSGIQTTSAGEQMYMYYHERETLRSSLEENGFTIINEERKKYEDQNGKDALDLIIVAKSSKTAPHAI